MELFGRIREVNANADVGKPRWPKKVCRSLARKAVVDLRINDGAGMRCNGCM
jgi:hypothetical protein